MKHTYVKELMTSPAITCETKATINEVVTIMKEKNIGFIPITKNNILVGVVTDRDIVIRGFGIYKSNTKIEKVMTNGEIHFVNEDTTLIEAAKIMAKQKIRRLVVLKDGKTNGIITTKKLLTEPELFPFIAQTYHSNQTIEPYSMYINSNPHDSIKTSDFPL